MTVMIAPATETLDDALSTPYRSRPSAVTVLVADDDDDIRDLVAFKLQIAGYDVFTADNGNDALKTARRRLPDLIVLDVSMPGMSGLDVCHQLHAVPETAHIPVMILSARTDPTEVDLGLALGADEYMLKPFSAADLVRRVRWLLLATP
jgi:DNA-binding response OmpR family regulator